MIVVTGATGKLGSLVVQALLERVPASEIVAGVRSVEKAADLKALGVEVREVDYAKPETLAAAFTGAEKVLLISSNVLGEERVAQHQAAIEAAVKAGVKLIAYTSVLGADKSKLIVAKDHLATEKAIAASGLKYVFLRNGWYLENYTENLKPALEHGAILGSAKDGRFSAAARADYADAAAVVLTEAGHENKIYELAGDSSFTLSELAAEVAKASGKTVGYKNLPEEAYATALKGFGLPAPIAEMLAQADVCAAEGELENESRELSALLGRPTTSLADAVAAAVK
jgi:NAD(P)H dehydrogenase (quinone)